MIIDQIFTAQCQIFPGSSPYWHISQWTEYLWDWDCCWNKTNSWMHQASRNWICFLFNIFWSVSVQQYSLTEMNLETVNVILMSHWATATRHHFLWHYTLFHNMYISDWLGATFLLNLIVALCVSWILRYILSCCHRSIGALWAPHLGFPPSF